MTPPARRQTGQLRGRIQKNSQPSPAARGHRARFVRPLDTGGPYGCRRFRLTFPTIADLPDRTQEKALHRMPRGGGRHAEVARICRSCKGLRARWRRGDATDRSEATDPGFRLGSVRELLGVATRWLSALSPMPRYHRHRSRTPSDLRCGGEESELRVSLVGVSCVGTYERADLQVTIAGLDPETSAAAIDARLGRT